MITDPRVTTNWIHASNVKTNIKNVTISKEQRHDDSNIYTQKN